MIHNDIKRYLGIVTILVILLGGIIPNFSNAISVNEEIKLTGYGTVPYHLKAYSLNGGYISTHLVRIL